MFNNKLLVDAGLKPRHLARILNVSRVTASNWLRGKSQPHSLLADKAILLVNAVEAAVEAEELPVSKNLPTDEASVKTVSVTTRYMAMMENAEAFAAADRQ